MTRNRDAKRRIRQRMAITGERYTVARQALLGLHRASADDARGGDHAMSTTALITLQLATDTNAEQEVERQLRAMLEHWTLDKYVYFECVRIDENAPGRSTFPVPTLPAEAVSTELEHTLAAFLELQMSWALNEVEGAASALADAATFAEQPRAFVARLLTIDALSELLGPTRAAELVEAPPGGAEFKSRHRLDLPESPPLPSRRSAPIELGPGGPVAVLAMGHRHELQLAERLRAFHEKFDLRAWRFSPQVKIQSIGPPDVTGAVPALSTYFLFWDDADVLMNYIQLQASWWANQQPQEALASVLPALDAPLRVTFACAVALDAIDKLMGPDAARQAVERHPRNRAIYEALAPNVGVILRALQSAGVTVIAP